jgi:hypothetical protein
MKDESVNLEKSPGEFVFRGAVIPERMCGGLERYLEQHVPPGDFLEAVLCNDLTEACSRADDENMGLLPVYVAYLYNYAPGRAWGSREKFEAWLARRAS